VSSDLEAARAYIDAHFLERVTIASVAAVARLSPSQFSRAFRRAFGAAPYVYLENKRLQHARSAIAGGEPISSAALSSRFSDQAHLTRRFKRTWGITPGVMARTTYPLRDTSDRTASSN
jgi:AraC-like DNA-binding protein